MPDWSQPDLEWDEGKVHHIIDRHDVYPDEAEQVFYKRDTLVPPLPEGYPERVPEFATEEEERDFWDTHDSAPYFYEGEDVTHALRSARQSSETPAFPRMLSRSGSKQARISGRSKKISASRGVNCKRR